MSRKISLVASAAFFAIAVHSSASAAERDTVFGTDEVLDALCVAAVPPSDSSGFTTYALNAQTSTETITVNVGDPYIVPIGNPIENFDGLVGPVHVNGYSPNIWAYYNKVLRYASAERRQDQAKFVRTTHSASGCHVHKPGAGNSQVDHDNLPGHGDYNAPPGLQITTALTSSTDGPQTPAGFVVLETIAPYDDPNNVIGGQALICISPTTTDSTKKGNPGTWKSQHGFNGTLKTYPGPGSVTVGACSTTLWNTAFGNSNNPASGFETTPSNSLPPQ